MSPREAAALKTRGTALGHLTLVRRRRRSRKLITRSLARRLAPLAIVAAIAVAASIFGVLLEQVVLAQSAFDLSSIRQRMAKAEARHEELLLEAARLDSSARIERYARDTLGMVDPGPSSVQYIVAEVRIPGSDKGESPRPSNGHIATQTGLASGYHAGR